MAQLTIEQAYQLAARFYAAGQVADAESLCRQVLTHQPGHAAASRLLEAISRRSGHAAAPAVPFAARSLNAAGDWASYFSRGDALQMSGRLDEAIIAYRQALALRPETPEVYNNLAAALRQKGLLDDAVAAYRRAVALQPDFPEAHNNLGLALIDRGQLDEAIAAFRQAIARRPTYADAHGNLATALRRAGRLDDAVAAFRQAFTLGLDRAEAYNSLGVTLWQQRRLDEAAAAYRQALARRPDLAEAWSNLGQTLCDAGRLDEAEDAVRRALALPPVSPQSHTTHGNVLRRQGRFEEAEAAYRKALTLRPDYADATLNLGGVLFQQARYAEADAAYRKVLALRPGHAEARFCLALVLLLRGDFERGWAEYESRLASPEIARSLGLPLAGVQRVWDGGDLAGRRILLHSEQGLGDTLQFIRYAPLVAARGGKVIVQCQPPLARLLDDNRDRLGVERVLPVGDPPPEHEVFCPLMSLPRAFGTTLQTIPAEVPYLAADAERVERWRARIASRNQEPVPSAEWGMPSTQHSALVPQHSPAPQHSLNVGLVWAGAAKDKEDETRLVPLSSLAPLGGVARVRFFSLQKGPQAAEAKAPPAGMDLVDWTEELHDFADTAALVANLDLVITVDTSVAHLAGAMGKPVWVLLPLVPGVLWLLDRSDSPWYPTMRLFRQPKIGDWGAVAREVAAELTRMAAAVRAPASPATGGPPPQAADPALVIQAASQHLAAGRMDEAERLCREALSLRPEDPEAMLLLAFAAQQTGRHEAALDLAGRAVASQPGSAESRNKFGMILSAQGRNREAVEQFREAARTAPGEARYHGNLGAALIEAGEYAEAAEQLGESLRLRPDHAPTLMSLGAALMGLRCVDDAIDCLRRAVALRPQSAKAHYGLALALLCRGDLAEGFAEYEWRWKPEMGGFATRQFARPRWTGQDVRGRTILIDHEQGIGDSIQFARYATMVAERVGPEGRMILECPTELAPLFQSVPGVSQVSVYGTDPPPFDLHCPQMSLPLVFGIKPETVPNRVPYLFPETAKVDAWRQRMAGAEGVGPGSPPRLRVGLAWSGRPVPDPGRSCGLAALAPLASAPPPPGVVFYSLQKGEGAAEAARPRAGMRLIDLTGNLHDMAETAALVQNLDLVVSIDTAVAHLAGAMGKPVWTLLSYGSDWRWMTERPDSPWYPTMRLFRQPRRGDWETPIRQAAERLADWVRTGQAGDAGGAGSSQ